MPETTATSKKDKLEFNKIRTRTQPRLGYAIAIAASGSDNR
jgi:hypothetical protein